MLLVHLLDMVKAAHRPSVGTHCHNVVDDLSLVARGGATLVAEGIAHCTRVLHRGLQQRRLALNTDKPVLMTTDKVLEEDIVAK
eukprot:5140666-Amphidinium_carterae.1